MDTMHGAVADTSYFMREGFPLDAAFLTPIALLTYGPFLILYVFLSERCAFMMVVLVSL